MPAVNIFTHWSVGTYAGSGAIRVATTDWAVIDAYPTATIATNDVVNAYFVYRSDLA